MSGTGRFLGRFLGWGQGSGQSRDQGHGQGPGQRRGRGRTPLVTALMLASLCVGAGAQSAGAQSAGARSPGAQSQGGKGAEFAAGDFTIVAADGATTRWAVDRTHGHAAVGSDALEALGWRPLGARGEAIEYQLDGATLELRPGLPLVRWNDEWVQLVAPPYADGGRLFVPVQLLSDVLPDRLPERVAALNALQLAMRRSSTERPAEGPAEQELPDTKARAAAPVVSSTGVGEAAGSGAVTDPIRAAGTGPRRPSAAVRRPGPQVTPVVVLDPGHGGRDPGSIGPEGTREKDVALALARRIRDELERTSDFEVHLTRDSDDLVPIWERGVIATRLKGDRPGIFISIHTNAVGNRGVRGVETYFLAEARTEHERRVAALENEAASFDRITSEIPEASGDLGFMLSELSNLDHIHWSSDLAAEVQREIARVHPGPNRGVKQGPLAVITNALMPSVLVEAGFISNPGEERVLGDPSFQQETARAIARAVTAFFERYPPGQKAR
jgi:N-acetylmuramoyl-L-alanine amidase